MWVSGSEHDNANTVTSYEHLGPPEIAALDSRDYREVSGISEGGHTTRTSRFIVKSHNEVRRLASKS